MKKELKNLKDTKKFAKEFLEMVINGDEDRNVIFLQGELGAGKTTFSQYFLKAMGASGPFTSPTFVIMKKYELKNCVEGRRNQVTRLSNLVPTTGNPVVGPLEKPSEKQNIYHLDCYRVDSASVLDLGWEELVANKNNLLLVEWPEKIKNIWPKNYWLLKFEYGKNIKSTRNVEIKMI